MAGIKHAVENSYRFSGEHATATDDIVSKQAIMKNLQELDIPAVIPNIKR